MKCPFCQHPNTQVTDSRWLEDTNSIRRRRKCLECGQRFSTFETVEMRMPQVIKSNGTRVPFNPHKLQTSLERALHKRPVTQEQIDETVALIEQRLYRLGKKEVASRIVGEMAMEELAKSTKSLMSASHPSIKALKTFPNSPKSSPNAKPNKAVRNHVCRT